MDIEVIENLIIRIDELTIEEKRILSTIEKRLSVLYLHKKMVRDLRKLITKYIMQQKSLEGKRFSIARLISVKKKNVLQAIDEIRKLVLGSFTFKDGVDNLFKVLNNEEDYIKEDIKRKALLFEQIRKIKESGRDSENFRDIAQQINEFVAADNRLIDYIKDFETHMTNFKENIEKFNVLVEDELSLLDKLHKDVDDGATDNIEGQLRDLERIRKNIDDITKKEKESIHNPLERLFNIEKRYRRLVRRLKRRGRRISLDDIKKDMQTFSNPETFTAYEVALMKSGLLSDKERKLLLNGQIMYSTKSKEIGLEKEKRIFNLKKEKEEAEKNAELDPLTGLMNRRTFDRILNTFLGDKREKPIYSMIMVDADHFKNVNDTYGHHKGDEVLKFLADSLRLYFKRDSDFVSRFGGEEFVILLKYTNLEKAHEVAEKFRIYIEKESGQKVHDGNGNPINITVCLGVVEGKLGFKSTISDFESQLRKADGALYVAKETGRNKVVDA